MGAKIFPIPGMFDHKSDEFGACDFCRLGIIEDRVMIPLMAARGHVHSHHAEGDLMLRLIKALSEEVMRLAPYGIQDPLHPQTPLAHTAIPFKGDESILVVTHDSIIAQMGKIRAIIDRGVDRVCQIW